MDHFDYHNGTLHVEGVSVASIAEAVGTPFYCYASSTIERHYRVFDEPFDGLDRLVCYSVKANSNVAVIRTLAELGSGADVVSLGELRRALAAGVPPGRIVFSGVGKTAEEMVAALDVGIHQFNVESEPELELLNSVAEARGTTAPVALRINPDVDANTHHKISTGRSEDKFGIPWSRASDVFALAKDLRAIEVVGIDVHIGSQITALAPFESAFGKVRDLVGQLRRAGHDIRRLDLGGGLGIPYHGLDNETVPPSPQAYGEVVRRLAGDLDCQLIFEPGRLIVGNAGILVARVLYVKRGESRAFVVVDAAMNDLVRPALYDGFHTIVPIVEAPVGALIQGVDVVGPICETGDTFATNRPMPPLVSGDLIAILSAGAYGAAQASTYNSRLLVPEVLVKGDDFDVIRERPTYEDMLAGEHMPDWLKVSG